MEVFEEHRAESTCYSGSGEELCIWGFVLKISAAADMRVPFESDKLRVVSLLTCGKQHYFCYQNLYLKKLVFIFNTPK